MKSFSVIFLYFCSMRNLSKITAILFSCVLFFSSIITEKYCFILNSHSLTSAEENLSSRIPDEIPDYFLLNRNGEHLVALAKNMPAFSLGGQSSDIYSNTLLSEPKKLRKNSEYLHSSGTISRNLPNSDIIFPFHYFW